MSMDHMPGFVEKVTLLADFIHNHLKSGELESCRNKPWELVEALEEFTHKHNIPMLISKAKMEVMRDVLAKTEPKPKILLEFGAYVGNSAVGWGAIMRELHGSNLEGVHAYAFELDPQIAECARAMVKFAGVDDIVTIIQGTASDSIKKLLAEGKIQPGNVDVAFIDHWEKYYVPDLQLCEELKILHLNSVVLADNTDYPGAPTYLKYVKAGGSGVPGAVRYESESVTVTKEKNPTIVEVSRVVSV